MFVKKPTEQQISDAESKVLSVFPTAKRMTDAPVREYMLKWLSAFAPDVTYRDAKASCLPRRLYKNYLSNAFSMNLTYSTPPEDEKRVIFSGNCYILLNGENILFSADGADITFEKLKGFENAVVFDEKFTLTVARAGNEVFIKEAENA